MRITSIFIGCLAGLLTLSTQQTLLNKPFSFAHCGDPHKDRNETIRLELTQQFFDDIQNNLLVPFFLNIDHLFNWSVNPIGFAGDIGILNVSGNVTNLFGNHIHLGNDTSLIALHDDYITFNLSELVLDGSIGYEFITDPPIMADIGFLNISIDGLEILFNATTEVENGDLKLNLTYVHAQLEHFGLVFDGLNDFLWSLNGLLNTIFDVVLTRLRPIVE